MAGLACLPALSATAQQRRTLTINDVLDVQRIDQATLSPDGNWVAAVVQRPARTGEIYGRIAYEIDPTRSDVWLIDVKTGKRRALTDGAADAAGYWCASWSPDGRRLAVLSTQATGGEPRGGDNVRLYIWDRYTGAMTRMSDTAVMTQTRYGGALHKLDLRGGAVRRSGPHACNLDEDGAPFLWLDARRLLVLTLPEGQVSGILDQYSRPFVSAARTASRLRSGVEPTALAMGSGEARLPRDETNRAVLRVVDVTTRRAETVAAIPTYPLRSSLSLWVSPDGKRVAALTPLGALQPEAGQILPNHTDENWTVERGLSFIDIAPNASIRWVMPPPQARYPLALVGWAADGRLAYSARGSQSESEGAQFLPSHEGSVAPQPERADSDQIKRNIAMPADGVLLDDRPDLGTVLWSESGRTGLTLRISRASTKTTTRDLLTLNNHLAAIDWGETRLVDYVDRHGQSLKAVAILPPGIALIAATRPSCGSTAGTWCAISIVIT